MKLNKTIIAIAIVSTLLVFISLFANPRVREYDLNNRSILREFKPKETFSIIFITVVSIVSRLRPDFGTIKEGRKSFLSGHTGTSTAGFLILIVFLNGYYDKLRTDNILCNLTKVIRTFLLLTIPFIVRSSTFYDNRHFVSDILCEGLIALGSTFILYKYFGYQLLQRSETDTSK